ncbi:KxYKxGKxW signal peptide domain-containing protein [Secundilactobacillus hailunensis]|uniref:KxYKxGKxW signal peptide domain-containing protein n=1 Tax=Secundilactobacillus hailunensis TaxID=2559923 RepID=A0ABW1T6B1_9LACO|nr:KxYKxGKxW signal peptide domain-containing protein [Secundilactobacillus hailunensis]
MVGKNNNIRTIETNLTEHYKAYKSGKQWIYVSLASVALGAELLLGGNLSAYADTATSATPTATNVNASNTSADVASTAANKTAVNTGSSASTADSKTNINTGHQQTATNSGATTSNGSDSNLNTTSKLATNNDAQSAATQTPTTVQTPQTRGQAPESEATSTAPQIQTKQSNSDVPAPVSRTQVAASDQQFKSAQTYAAALAPQNLKTAQMVATADATLNLSSPAVGYGSNAKSPLTATLKVTAKAGDVYVIYIPANTPVFSYSSVQPLTSTVGTTIVSQHASGAAFTITNTFKIDAVISQEIKFNLANNYGATDTMADVGKTVTKTIDWSANGVKQTPVTFTQTIKPTINLTPVVMTYPNQENIPEVVPDTNYVFSMNVNEANGVLDNGYQSGRVNRGDNFGGSTITIPVPAGFKLDEGNTQKINEFSDKTTITQPGGAGSALIINVPAGSGAENWEAQGGYRLVGSFEIAQPETDTVYTADGATTFSQIMNADGDKLTGSVAPWTVKILGVNTGGGSVGNGVAGTTAQASKTSLLLDNDPTNDPSFLSSFGFYLDSMTDTSGAKITITIPDGLDATGIQTPASAVNAQVYLPGTTSYQYTLTLADGTTETGSVNAGEKVTAADGSAIRKVVLTPNYLAPGANTSRTGNLNPNKTPAAPYQRFIVEGQLAHRYDDGRAVKSGDKLMSTITLGFANETQPQKEATSTITQAVVDAVALAIGYKQENSSTPGVQAAGYLAVQGGEYGQVSKQIFEPTYYFVIPTATTVTNVTAKPGAKISTFKADDGHTVVKIDYSGTGITVNTDEAATIGQVNLANNPDALPGNYAYLMYIASPTTTLSNTTKVTDKTYTDGNPDAVLMQGGAGDWQIVTASSFYNTALAQGNTNSDPVTHGISDDKGSTTLTFYDNVVYTSLAEDAKNSNAEVAINLPTIGKNGSQYTFNLMGPIKVPTHYTVVSGTGAPMDATVLYSTDFQKVTGDETTPDTTGYVSASEVMDWSKVRSVIVKVNGIKANTATGRIELTGTTAQPFAQQAGKTGNLQTVFYGNGAKVSLGSDNASIKITGTSTIKARYHYVDASGQDQYVYLDDLNQTLADNVDEFKNNYPTQLTGFSAKDKSLLPAGYQLVTDATGNVTPKIIDGTGNGAAKFGTVAQASYNGDFVQYDLVDQASALMEYVDDDNDGAIVGTPTPLTGTTNGTAHWDTAGQVPANYALAKGQAASGTYTFTAAPNQVLQIHLVHQLTTGTATTIRTITYMIANGDRSKTPAPVIETMNWKTVTDKVTGISYAAPLNDYAAVPNPVIAGYTPHSTVKQLTEGPMLTSQLSKLNMNVIVLYTADKQTVSITYVNTKTDQPIKTIVVTGKTDDPIVVPDLPGYTLDRSGDPTSFEPGLTKFNVPATPNEGSGNTGGGSGNTGTTTTPGDPDTGTTPDNPDTTTTPGEPGTATTPDNPDIVTTVDNTGTAVAPETPATSQSEGQGVATGSQTSGGNVKTESTATTKGVSTEQAPAQAGLAVTTSTTTKVTGQANDSKTNSGKLPQTNERNDQAAGLSLLGLVTGVLSLLGVKRRKHDNG